MTEYSEADVDRAAQNVTVFLEAVDAVTANDTDRASLVMSDYCDSADDPILQLHAMTATGIALVAAVIDSVAASEVDNQDDYAWEFPTSFAQIENDPVTAAVGQAVAATANRNTDLTSSILQSTLNQHGPDALVGMTSLLLQLFARLREDVADAEPDWHAWIDQARPSRKKQ